MKKKTLEQKEARFQVKERAYRDQVAKLQKLVREQDAYIRRLMSRIGSSANNESHS